MDAISSLLRHIHDKYGIKYIVYNDGIIESKMMSHLYIWSRLRNPEDTTFLYCAGMIHSTTAPKTKFFRMSLDLSDPSSNDKLEKEAIRAIVFMNSCNRCKSLNEQSI